MLNIFHKTFLLSECDDTNTEHPPPEDAESASGLNEADYNASVATLRSIAMSLDSDCVLLRESYRQDCKTIASPVVNIIAYNLHIDFSVRYVQICRY